MSTFVALIDDLEAAVQTGSQEKRVEMLRHVTDLFLGNAKNFNNEHVDLFGDVLAHLTKQVESKVLAEISEKLAPVENAPNAFIQRLAHHDEITIAGPVLAQSPQLSDGDLIEIAKTKSQGHLGAISERARIAAVVTDILVERGDTAVVHKLSQNQGATFSTTGITTLTKRAETDERLAENLSGRLDMPPQLLQELLAKATEAIRARLLAAVPPEGQAAIQELLKSASSKVLREKIVFRDFRHAELLVAQLHSRDQLHEVAVMDFANAGKYEETVACLARLSGAQVELIDQLMQNIRYDGILVACKAADLHWPTFSAILQNRFSDHQISAPEIEQAKKDFIKLSAATAKRMFRFWLIRGTSKVGP